MKKWYQKWWGILLIIVLLLTISFLASFGFKVWQDYVSIQSGVNLPNFSESKLEGVVNINGDYLIIPEVDDDPKIGPEDAKVTVIAFESFECVYCKEEFVPFRATIEKYKDRVQFVYRDFEYPASAGAMAAECADDQGKFWELHDQIFLNQDQISVNNLKSWAGQIGLDMDSFNQCLDSEKYKSEVEKDFKDGQLGGVSGTPTFFVNGYKIQGTISEEGWSKVLDYLLNN